MQAVPESGVETVEDEAAAPTTLASFGRVLGSKYDRAAVRIWQDWQVRTAAPFVLRVQYSSTARPKSLLTCLQATYKAAATVSGFAESARFASVAVFFVVPLRGPRLRLACAKKIQKKQLQTHRVRTWKVRPTAPSKGIPSYFEYSVLIPNKSVTALNPRVPPSYVYQ